MSNFNFGRKVTVRPLPTSGPDLSHIKTTADLKEHLNMTDTKENARAYEKERDEAAYKYDFDLLLDTDLKSSFIDGANWSRAYHMEYIRELVDAATKLLERIDHNSGLGEYNGGPAHVVEPLREALKVWRGEE